MAAASSELGELAAEFGSLGRELQADPEGFGPLEERMNAWLEARRRHGPDVHSVAAAREAMRRRVEMQGDIEGTLARLDRQIEAAAREARKAAAELRSVREKAAKSLARAAEAGIAELGFEKAQFRIAITDAPGLGPTATAAASSSSRPTWGRPRSRSARSPRAASSPGSCWR